MAIEQEKLSNEPSGLGETIAGTGPGIPDDALGPGEELAQAPSDEEVKRAAKSLHAPIPEERNTLPLEGE